MKQVILMRNDLGMSTGKMVAQGIHAAHQSDAPTIVLQGTEAEVEECLKQAVRSGLRVKYVHDAGRTEIPPGTFTCGSIGPAEDTQIDKITGQLKTL